MAASTVFAALLLVWQEGDPARVDRLITADYVGHMLHLEDGDRDTSTYAVRITEFRAANPGCRFEIRDQVEIGDRLFTRLVAVKPDGSFANGMNTSRFADGRISEEWAIWTAFRPS